MQTAAIYMLLQKHNARAAVVLRPQLLSQSFLLADLVGMTIAGLAMCLAVGAIYVATRFSTNQLSGAYVTIIVVGYMLKDRVKEWGKRYLQPTAMKFGFEFPDRTVKVGLAIHFSVKTLDGNTFCLLFSCSVSVSGQCSRRCRASWLLIVFLTDKTQLLLGTEVLIMTPDSAAFPVVAQRACSTYAPAWLYAMGIMQQL